jgi:hypothetical protein
MLELNYSVSRVLENTPGTCKGDVFFEVFLILDGHSATRVQWSP